jgi:UDP-hydrolysing UDP-N-acetyl-D-glucosamine 2-epimerase
VRTVGVVTTSRGDYGILRPVLNAIDAHPQLTPRVYAGGTHFATDSGPSIREIEHDGFTIAARIDLPAVNGDALARAVALGATTAAYAEAFAEERPDVVVLIGDRYETHAAAVATVPLGLPLAHVHGGELTEGPPSTVLLHSITKLSHLHFAATAEAGRRIRQLGEEDWRVHLSGAPVLDGHGELLPREHADPYVLVTYRPVRSRPAESPDALLEALEEVTVDVVIAQPAEDGTLDALRTWATGRAGTTLVVDPDRRRYLSLMAHAEAIAGNATAGIVEAASFRLPVVDVGSRQRGRTRGENVLSAIDDPTAIALALEEALDPDFRETLAGMQNPYGDGHAGPRIADALATVELDERLLVKRFQDR